MVTQRRLSMIKKFFTIITVLLFALMVLPLLRQIVPFEELAPVAASYAEEGPDELGAANLVTSVIVTYRGLDTLGEVTVLFIATAGVGFLLRREEDQKTGMDSETPEASPTVRATGMDSEASEASP